MRRYSGAVSNGVVVKNVDAAQRRAHHQRMRRATYNRPRFPADNDRRASIHDTRAEIIQDRIAGVLHGEAVIERRLR